MFSEHKKNQKGATMVECSILLFLFLLLLYAFIDIGRGVWVYNTLAHASREGARYAIVHGSESNNPADPSTIEAIVKDKAPLQGIIVTTTWPSGDNNQGSVVQVVAQYDYQPLSLFGISPIQLSAASRMVISY